MVEKGRLGKQIAEKHPRSLSQKDCATHVLHTSPALVQSFIKRSVTATPTVQSGKDGFLLFIQLSNVPHPCYSDGMMWVCFDASLSGGVALELEGLDNSPTHRSCTVEIKLKRQAFGGKYVGDGETRGEMSEEGDGRQERKWREERRKERGTVSERKEWRGERKRRERLKENSCTFSL